jgi:hypothetical protein
MSKPCSEEYLTLRLSADWLWLIPEDGNPQDRPTVYRMRG